MEREVLAAVGRPDAHFLSQIGLLASETRERAIQILRRPGDLLAHCLRVRLHLIERLGLLLQIRIRLGQPLDDFLQPGLLPIGKPVQKLPIFCPRFFERLVKSRTATSNPGAAVLFSELFPKASQFGASRFRNLHHRGELNNLLAGRLHSEHFAIILQLVLLRDAGRSARRPAKTAAASAACQPAPTGRTAPVLGRHAARIREQAPPLDTTVFTDKIQLHLRNILLLAANAQKI